MKAVSKFSAYDLGYLRFIAACGPNELLDDCPGDCAADFCPKGEAPLEPCRTPEPCPAPACKCSFDHRRADNGTCVATRDCPPFVCSKPNEVFDPCPPLCPTDDCSMARFGGQCPPLFGNILIVLPCTPKCKCKSGYWRRDGVCVPAYECPIEKNN
ncbi:hypothetical protein EVAR_64027_1 [Eumeta japonica]|uniref:TIL domain-containing protein n=1 Tax=Eumeta variegata TaxID=151549 RepID=A0A4C1Z1P1_EUMVA|nr:hypothetical protein EVAR_64027_1 [Eumeta japonica]